MDLNGVCFHYQLSTTGVVATFLNRFLVVRMLVKRMQQKEKIKKNLHLSILQNASTLVNSSFCLLSLVSSIPILVPELTYNILSSPAISKLNNNPIANWDTRFETGTKTALLHPFSPIVVAADENERIRYESFIRASLKLNLRSTSCIQVSPLLGKIQASS